MHVWIIEEITVYPPGFVKNLPPFFSWIDFDFNRLYIDFSLSDLDFSAEVGNSPGVLSYIENLFLIS